MYPLDSSMDSGLHLTRQKKAPPISNVHKVKSASTNKSKNSPMDKFAMSFGPRKKTGMRNFTTSPAEHSEPSFQQENENDLSLEPILIG